MSNVDAPASNPQAVKLAKSHLYPSAQTVSSTLMHVQGLVAPSRGHRTVLGQDVSYRRDPTEQTYTYLIYVQREASEIRITSNDGWYGVKTVLCDDEQIAITLFDQIIASPTAMFQEIYEDDCAWFEPFEISGRTADGSDSVMASDAQVHVTVSTREPAPTDDHPTTDSHTGQTK